MQVHCVGGQRGSQHRSVVGVGFLRLSHPALFLYFFRLHPYSKWSFFRNFFTLVSVFGGGGCKPIFIYSSFHLQIRYHTADKHVITSDEIASATHLRTWYHTADKLATRQPLLFTSEYDIILQANAFIASNEHVLCWSRDEHLALEMKVFCTGDEHVENTCSNFSHTHTASYQGLPTKLMPRWLLVTTTHLQEQALSRCGDPKGM